MVCLPEKPTFVTDAADLPAEVTAAGSDPPAVVSEAADAASAVAAVVVEAADVASEGSGAH